MQVLVARHNYSGLVNWGPSWNSINVLPLGTPFEQVRRNPCTVFFKSSLEVEVFEQVGQELLVRVHDMDLI